MKLLYPLIFLLLSCSTEPEVDEYSYYQCYINNDNPNCEHDGIAPVTHFIWFNNVSECESACPETEVEFVQLDTTYFTSCYGHNDTTCVNID